MIYQAETQEVRDMGMARDIAETLHAHYPGHLWAVNVKSGVATIKALNISSQWGMVLHYENIKGDAKVRAERVMRSGGEFLERAHLSRGKYRAGERAKVLEGAPDYSPLVQR